jgi:two-component system, cell cycle response regulator
MSGKILIVDDLAINRIILKVKLAAAFHESLQAGDGQSALEIARTERPKLILLDMMLPDMTGAEVCRQLRADPRTRHIPVVIITASTDRDRRLGGLAAGADEYLTKPLNDSILQARIRSLLRATESEEELRMRAGTFGDLGFAEPDSGFVPAATVGLIAPTPIEALRWRSALEPHLTERLQILTAAEALNTPDTGAAADLYLVGVDPATPGPGLRLVADLRSRAESRYAAISLVLDGNDTETAAMALDIGANDMLALPFDPEETALRVRLQLSRKHRADQLRRQMRDGLQLAVTDPLTGLFNRRYALHHLDRIANRAQGAGGRFAVMVVDIDRFKSINDTHGHLAGDQVLVQVATRLRDGVRPSDLLARIGGEEFLIALPEATPESARLVAERLRTAISSRPFSLPGTTDTVQATISVGLALGGGADRATLQVLDRADHALLAAKSDGRNQVTMAA